MVYPIERENKCCEYTILIHITSTVSVRISEWYCGIIHVLNRTVIHTSFTHYLHREGTCRYGEALTLRFRSQTSLILGCESHNWSRETLNSHCFLHSHGSRICNIILQHKLWNNFKPTYSFLNKLNNRILRHSQSIARISRQSLWCSSCTDGRSSRLVISRVSFSRIMVVHRFQTSSYTLLQEAYSR